MDITDRLKAYAFGSIRVWGSAGLSSRQTEPMLRASSRGPKKKKRCI